MKCYNCGKDLNEESVYSNRGWQLKCCSASCLAYACLDVRHASLKQTKKMMGEE